MAPLTRAALTEAFRGSSLVVHCAGVVRAPSLEVFAAVREVWLPPSQFEAAFVSAVIGRREVEMVLGAADELLERQIGTWVPIVLHMGWEIGDDFAALGRLARRIAPYAASWDDFLCAVDASRG